MRRYLWFYALAYLSVALLWGAVLTILLPLHVQELQFDRFFTGQDAGVDLQKLATLQAHIDDGTATATAEQQRLLDLLSEFNAARASSLSVVTSVSIMVTMLFQPVIGLLSDRTRSPWGRRAPWIAAGGVAGAAFVCLMPVVPNVAALVIVWSLVNLAGGLAQGPLTATVADRVPEERIGMMSAVTGLAAYLGAIVGAVVLGVLFAVVGVAAYFPIAVVLLLGTLAFVIFARDTSSRDDAAAEPLRLGAVVKNYGIALRDRDYRWAWISKVLLYLGYSISGVYGVYMLQDYISPALSAQEAAKTAPLLQFAALPGTLIAMSVVGRWSDKIGRRKPFVIAAALIMATGFLIPLVSPTLPAMFAQAAVTGFGYGMFVVIDQALFIDVLPDREAAARDLGFSMLGQNLGQALGPIAAGIVVSLFAGAYGPVWPVAFVLVVASALAVLPVKRVK
ncbi:MFS transporter [Streptomyces ardesiacus]|uniref:MFS transporter n=1 Tax=Streptomyces ardesiacus TaxID=285564 RepID=UPI003F4A3040